MEHCNQSVSKAVTTRFFSAGIGHCTHQGSSGNSRLIAWASSGRVSPWVPARTDAVDRVIKWYAYKERKTEGRKGGGWGVGTKSADVT